MSKASEIPEHPELISVSQAAEILDIDRNSVYFKIYETKAFATVYRVGGDERPFLLLSREEVERVAREDPKPALKKRLTAWHGRIREWAEVEFYPYVPTPAGRLPVALIDHYVKSHPQDPRPV